MRFDALTFSALALSASVGAPRHAQEVSEGEAVTHYVYVTAESADRVALVAFQPPDRLEVVEQIPVGYQATEIEGPHGLAVAPDGEHWFVSVAHGKPFGWLYKYRTDTNELVGQCQLGLYPATMQISDATGLLYCVNFDLHGDMTPSSVSVVDPDAMVEVARTTTGSMPHGSRLSPDGLRHYSCAMMTDELYEIDATSFEVARVLRLTLEGEGEDRTAAKLEGSEGGAMAAGMSTGMRDGMKPVAKPTWVTPHPTKPVGYVALNAAAQIAEVDLENWKILRRFTTDKGPYNLAIDHAGKRLVVTHKGAQSVGVWDLEAGRELARIATSEKVTHGVVLSPDGRYAFASNEAVGGTPGTLDVIDLESLERIASTPIGLQAGGIAFFRTEGA